MKSPLHILHLEDDVMDAELVQETLLADGIECEITRVETEADFLAALEQGGFDLVFADYSLPSFDGFSALKVVQRKCPDLPVIFVSGTMVEELPVEALKLGGTDYVLKARLLRIVPSVKRAVREAEERAELAMAQEALRRSEAYLGEAQKLSRTGSFGWEISSGKIYWSEETFRIFECDPATEPTLELINQRTHPKDKALIQQVIDSVSHESKDFDVEHRLLMPDGSVKYLHVVGRLLTDRSRSLEFIGAVTDITERKRAEEALRASENRWRKLFENSSAGIALVAPEGRYLATNFGVAENAGIYRGRVPEAYRGGPIAGRRACGPPTASSRGRTRAPERLSGGETVSARGWQPDLDRCQWWLRPGHRKPIRIFCACYR